MQRRKDRGYWTGADTAAEGVILLTGLLGVLMGLVLLKLAWPPSDRCQREGGALGGSGHAAQSKRRSRAVS